MENMKTIQWAVIASIVSAMFAVMLGINAYFLSSWVEQTNGQLLRIRQDLKTMEISLTVLSSSLVTRQEVRAIAEESVRMAIAEELRKHERTHHYNNQ